MGTLLHLPVGEAREAYLRRKMSGSNLVSPVPETGFGGYCIICGLQTCASEFLFAGTSFHTFICETCF